MPKHLPPERNATRRKCPVEGTHGPLEWIEVRNHASQKVTYYIPRLCCEFLGVPVELLAPGIAPGTTWFRKDHSKAMHDHEHIAFYKELG